ncbi:MAG: T9SS type A sorting domain-containing protein [Saprospiraceae bacterium]|nr:T9SS type A sorting domain-containing protein [Saprospiraceae bacterium]MCF8248334.1 T9SS type A sorting domain-containing protein [Saprospiraceae bacterium]MCF8280227.1 T9SS type A sorting domain-containing protein [Bacteroidales bacterium]MCF8309862.1 T9SS type A sorting domain-containing protein [Saprospiraceae bacterium]MCF8438807.1 T9SS type A sorting domain-containing protein [Saprospiraceae bacterium]
MRYLILFSLSILLSVTLFAQPEIIWEKSFGGSYNDYSYAVIQCSDGDYLSVGSSSSFNNGNEDVFIVKMSSEGTLIWQKTFGGSNDDYATSAIQTEDGGFLIGATTNSSDGDVTLAHGLSDIWLIKLSSIGELEWQKTYGGSSSECCPDIVQSDDGGFTFATKSKSNDGDISIHYGSFDAWVVKISQDGDIEWEKTFGGSEFDDIGAIRKTSGGNYIIIGSTASTDGDVTGNHGGGDVWVLKLDSLGNKLWQKCYGGSEVDGGSDIIETSSGSFICVGSSRSNDGNVSENNGSEDVWVFKITSLGAVLWEHSYGGSSLDYAQGISLSNNNGGYIVCGTSRSDNGDVSNNHGFQDYWVFKISNTGILEWNLSLGGSSSDFCYDIEQTTDNNIIVSGASYSNDGDVSSHIDYNDAWVVKLSPTPINEAKEKEIADDEGFRILPNPAYQKIQLVTRTNILWKSVLISDTIGRTVILDSKFNNVNLDISHLSSGIYNLSAISSTGDVYTSRFLKQ